MKLGETRSTIITTVATVDLEEEESLWTTSIGKYDLLVVYVLTNDWCKIDTFRIIGNVLIG